MTSQEIRQSFLDFFKSKEHTIVPSAPVVPHGDPTLLFTNAGMNQFKDMFLGTGNRGYLRAADTQKCIRVSGKHNDLEEVGVDTYHHTLFEMLGNWSFGDYYKKEAIAWAWELLVDVWKLPKERLYATVYNTDDEAYEIWKKFLPEESILRFGDKDNFWEMGETGPCGPCSEIHFDGTADMSGRDLVNASSPEVIEIWNLVFIQFERKIDGSLEPLASTHVDTGMGFERIVRVIQGKTSNYDTDVFMPLINFISQESKIAYNGSDNDSNAIAMRVIADHIRTLSFSIADGALPGNEGRGYVLRRILRRASRYARNLGFKEPFLYKLVPTLVAQMSQQFPELSQQQSTIEKVIKSEEESFLTTLEKGIQKFENLILSNPELAEVPGDEAFLLFDSFGFPLDLTELMAREKGISVDIIGFNEKMAEQKNRSRAARKKVSQVTEVKLHDSHTEFVGYQSLVAEAKVLWIEENKVITELSPFYVEKGGQISDTGTLRLGGIDYIVEDVFLSGNAIIHVLDSDIEPLIGDYALLQVNSKRRSAINRNHTATHLMHEALKRTLGTHLQQQGSLVSDTYLRFDFNHFNKLSDEEITTIEQIVNDKILSAIDVQTKIMTLDEAKADSRIKMYFGDKYGNEVRAVIVDDKYSIELCGGTHVKNSSEIGFFKISSESSIAAGIRRVEAVTAYQIEDYINNLKATISQKENTIIDYSDKVKYLEKELNKLKLDSFTGTINNLITKAENFKEIKIAVGVIELPDGLDIKLVGEKLYDLLTTNTIALLANITGDKVQLVCAVSNDLQKKAPAGKLIGDAAKYLGGGGGGKPNLATAGAKDASKLNDLFDKEIYQILNSYLA